MYQVDLLGRRKKRVRRIKIATQQRSGAFDRVESLADEPVLGRLRRLIDECIHQARIDCREAPQQAARGQVRDKNAEKHACDRGENEGMVNPRSRQIRRHRMAECPKQATADHGTRDRAPGASRALGLFAVAPGDLDLGPGRDGALEFEQIHQSSVGHGQRVVSKVPARSAIDMPGAQELEQNCLGWLGLPGVREARKAGGAEDDLTRRDRARWNGGDGEIRTHGRVSPSLVFKTRALNRSATSPERKL